jgi:predicted O-methyltransferase YrrM
MELLTRNGADDLSKSRIVMRGEKDLTGFSGKRWPQYQGEIDPFIALLQSEGVASYLEIGCRYGDTLHAVGMALPEGSRVVAVDLPGGLTGFDDSATYLQRAVDDLRANGYDANVFFGDSHQASMQALVRSLAPFDALFIDGDHTDEGVAADWKTYGPMARIVAFHDIAGHNKWARNIRPLYHRAREGRRWQDFIVNNRNRGIGVLWT